tara:strand:- start:596 stop:982 length:387 start_codon:yes stop_codon:yes gene_type:complete
MLFFGLIITSNFSCDSGQNQILNQGELRGKVTIGPICPVETNPPDPNCQPTAETYKAWPIAIWTSDKKTKVGLIQPNLDGTYTFEIPEGIYVVDLVNEHFFGSSLPVTVNISKNETTMLNIDIDTGIR